MTPKVAKASRPCFLHVPKTKTGMVKLLVALTLLTQASVKCSWTSTYCHFWCRSEIYSPKCASAVKIKFPTLRKSDYYSLLQILKQGSWHLLEPHILTFLFYYPSILPSPPPPPVQSFSLPFSRMQYCIA